MNEDQTKEKEGKSEKERTKEGKEGMKNQEKTYL
jgi:hypothetical protein